jgi:hypothetical protein
MNLRRAGCDRAFGKRLSLKLSSAMMAANDVAMRRMVYGPFDGLFLATVGCGLLRAH